MLTRKKDTTVTPSRRFMQRARLLPFRRARTPIWGEKFISYTDLMIKIL